MVNVGKYTIQGSYGNDKTCWSQTSRHGRPSNKRCSSTDPPALRCNCVGTRREDLACSRRWPAGGNHQFSYGVLRIASYQPKHTNQPAESIYHNYTYKLTSTVYEYKHIYIYIHITKYIYVHMYVSVDTLKYIYIYLYIYMQLIYIYSMLQQKNSIPVERRTLPPTMLSDELKRFNSLALSFECWRYPWP